MKNPFITPMLISALLYLLLRRLNIENPMRLIDGHKKAQKAQKLRASGLCVSCAFLWLSSQHLAAASMAPLQPVFAEGGYHSGQIVLYNQMDVFESRAPSAEVIASFIKQLDAKAMTLWQDAKSENGRSGFIAVAIRPDRTMKLWIDLEGEYQQETTALLEKKMKAVGVPQTRNGPIAFAVHFDLWGGSPKPKEQNDQIQIPQSWQHAAEKQNRALTIPDDILPLVWEAKNPALQTNEPSVFVPEGFVLQELNPTGGTILRPDDWFYKEAHRKHVFMWTISKEDRNDGAYDTGVRIQCFTEVQKNTGDSPKEFVQSFVNGKKETAELISLRPLQIQDSFSRIGIEVKETMEIEGKQIDYRILYSCFWNNDSDIAVISISGTTQDLWEIYENTFNTMSSFTLIDMAKIESALANTTAAPNPGWKEIDNSSEWRAPPDGYEWVEIKEIDSAFLMPNGWHYASRKTEHYWSFSILQEASEEPSATGMTISVIEECQKNKNFRATDYYTYFASAYEKGCENVSNHAPVQQGNLTIYRGEVVKKFDDNILYQVLLFGIANNKTDTLQIIKYTCPLSEWEEHKMIAIPILQDIVINENL